MQLIKKLKKKINRMVAVSKVASTKPEESILRLAILGKAPADRKTAFEMQILFVITSKH